MKRCVERLIVNVLIGGKCRCFGQAETRRTDAHKDGLRDQLTDYTEGHQVTPIGEKIYQ